MSGSVSVPGVPASLAIWQKEIERRVAVLETSSRLYNSAIREGTLRIQDSSGNPMVTLGKLDDGTYGMLIQSSTGQTLFKVDSVNGQLAPTAILTPVVSVGALLSGAPNGFRPGTQSATYVSIWAHEFWSVGPKVDFNIVAYANAGDMDWRITAHEVGAPAVVVWGPLNETSNSTRNGTITIPASALLSGTDVAGRRMRLDIEAKKNSGPSTVDISLNNPPRNYGP
jgi:hypothetical protein